MRDLYSNISSIPTLANETHTESAAGDAVDLHGFDTAVAIVVVGAWADGEHAITLEHSDDGETFTAVPAAALSGAAVVVDSEDAAEQVYELGYRGTKRYLRVTSEVEEAEDGAIYGAVIVRGSPRFAPTR